MSSPTTPARSEVDSGLSTPSLSHNRAPEQQLTPRSKVKAMLAAFDDDTDSEDSVRGQNPHGSASTQKRSDTSKQVNSETAHGTSSNKHRGSEEDESDDVPVIPRGRLAARLYDRANQIESTTSARESPDEDAYERLKRKLIPRTSLNPEISIDSMQENPTNYKAMSTSSSPIHNFQARSESESSQSSKKSLFGIGKASPTLSSALESKASTRPSGEIGNEDSSDSDLPADPQTSSKLQLLVARKREELQAKKEAEAQKKAERKAQLQTLSTKRPLHHDPMSSGISDGDSGNQSDERRLTQHARPTRKASKKALEEMNRETQRMSRNMQLAHQAKTRKKISKESFLTRFNFGTNTHVGEAAQAMSSSTVVSSAPASDIEARVQRSSPPSSPDKVLNPSRESAEPLEFHGEDSKFITRDLQDVIPESLYIRDRPLPQMHEEKEESSEAAINRLLALGLSTRAESFKPPMRFQNSKPRISSMLHVSDSDSDLEIVHSKKPERSKLDIFDRLPPGNLKEERSLQTLRVLAQMNSPGKRNSRSKSSMTMSDMHISLQKRARKQAAEERAEKIQDLKDRGVIVQTAEEREKDQAEVEDLVDKARREATEIMEREKHKTRKEKFANGELDGTELTSDEDEDYQGNDADESDIDFSGSDEEQDPKDEESDDSGKEDEALGEGDEGVAQKFLIDAEASDTEQDEEREPTSEEGGDETHEVADIYRSKRRRRTHPVIQDDDDEAGENESQQSPAPSLQTTQQPQIPGLPFEDLPMGMTQAFVATMADTQSTQLGQGVDLDQEEDSLPFSGPMPEPSFPIYNFEESQSMVLDSQIGNLESEAVEKGPSQEIEIHYSQNPVRDNAFESTEDEPISTQYSEVPDPTQDVGFMITSPIQNRFVSVPPSTVDTVLLSGVARNSPTIKKKGRLRRRTEALDVYVDEEQDLSHSGAAEVHASVDAFNVMKLAARKPVHTVDTFDKDKSKAKEMVEEQAQESEDEYAGLGGVSDNESAQEEDEEVRKMIVDEEVEVDEGKLAAFYANKERADDEKAVEKLFKDINSGMLRRKRGAEFDLSDSDDDLEARQRAKRKEFAKMRKALLENENVGRIAQDPKKLAFLRAIEDQQHDSLSFLDQPEESSQVDLLDPPDVDPQSQPKLPTTSVSLKRKRPLQDSITDNANGRPASAWGVRPPKKPSTLAEIRKSVSLLIEQPGALSHPTQPSSSPPSSDNENSHTARESFASRRRTNPVIDRLSLKRAESNTASSSRLAFHDPTSAALGVFRVPSLLRRATTSQLASGGADKHGISTGTAATERAAGGGEKGDFVKRGGSRKSSIGYFAREKERLNWMQEADRNRREGLRKLSLDSLGLGRLAGGSFE